jgi:hypothetical protein
MTEPITITSFLVQIPIVGAFIYFCISLIRMFLDFLKQRDAQWQQWLETQRTMDNDYKTRIAEELKEVSGCMERLGAKIDTHHLYVIQTVSKDKPSEKSLINKGA